MRHEKSITTRTCLTELPPTSFYPLVDGNCVEAEPEEEVRVRVSPNPNPNPTLTDPNPNPS